MSDASAQPSEDQFLCSICLDVFRDPVTTTCGHNFCKDCISEHWDSNVHLMCPMCKETFPTRPLLKVNTFISAMVAQFRQSTQQNSSSSLSEQVVNPGEVQCDLCTGTKGKALKLCLVCLASYCETHLERHLTVPSLKNHQLIDHGQNLESRMCEKHDKPLFFCKTDQTCVCILCTTADHMTHEFAPLKEEYEKIKAELLDTEAELQKMIQERQLKVEEINNSVEICQKKAEEKIQDGVQGFNALIESLEQSLNNFIESISEKQKTAEKQAEDFIKELEQEISVLMKRSSEVKQLSRCEDQVHVLQSHRSLQAAPPAKDWAKVKVPGPAYDENLMRALDQLEEELHEDIKQMFFSELKELQQYAVNVILDGNTAHSNMTLSCNGKKATYCDERMDLKKNAERFTKSIAVLGEQSFSSGKFYFRVQVSGKTSWAVGVAAKSVNRKVLITSTWKRGYWLVRLRNENEYSAQGSYSYSLSLTVKPQKVGVFVDYDEGVVSFYDVENAALITSFTDCDFTEELYPLLCPGSNKSGLNSKPLIICR